MCASSSLELNFYANYLTDLVAITGNLKAMMHYTRYEEEIVQRYGIELQGWTYEKLMNPSKLSSSLPPLKALRDALVSGTCKFIKLTAAEKKKREAAYMASIASGEAELRKRKRRSDAGIRKKSKRPRIENDGGEEEEEEEQEEGDASHIPKSRETIEEDDDAEDAE
jgi:hypothetical protein